MAASRLQLVVVVVVVVVIIIINIIISSSFIVGIKYPKMFKTKNMC